MTGFWFILKNNFMKTNDLHRLGFGLVPVSFNGNSDGMFLSPKMPTNELVGTVGNKNDKAAYGETSRKKAAGSAPSVFV